MARLVLGLIHTGSAGTVWMLPGVGTVPGGQSGGGRLSSFESPLLCGGALQQQRYRADGPDPLRPLDGPSADEASGRPARAAVCVGGSLLCQHEGDRLRPLGAVRPVCAAAAAAPPSGRGQSLGGRAGSVFRVYRVLHPADPGAVARTAGIFPLSCGKRAGFQPVEELRPLPGHDLPVGEGTASMVLSALHDRSHHAAMGAVSVHRRPSGRAEKLEKGLPR